VISKAILTTVLAAIVSTTVKADNGPPQKYLPNEHLVAGFVWAKTQGSDSACVVLPNNTQWNNSRIDYAQKFADKPSDCDHGGEYGGGGGWSNYFQSNDNRRFCASLHNPNTVHGLCGMITVHLRN
jgi:hypothetical protein